MLWDPAPAGAVPTFDELIPAPDLRRRREFCHSAATPVYLYYVFSIGIKTGGVIQITAVPSPTAGSATCCRGSSRRPGAASRPSGWQAPVSSRPSS